MASAESRARAFLAAAASLLTRRLHKRSLRHTPAAQQDLTDNSNTNTEAPTRTRLPTASRTNESVPATDPAPTGDLPTAAATTHGAADQAEASLRTRLREMGVRP
ncbi:hypothetical protein [Streptomyces aureoversilis]|uniref:Uncharacterized protein n=1 Tax=Streptomyces aureoversilis TaxID=67277 RepID=A0ABW0A647_9ACTN